MLEQRDMLVRAILTNLKTSILTHRGRKILRCVLGKEEVCYRWKVDRSRLAVLRERGAQHRNRTSRIGCLETVVVRQRSGILRPGIHAST